MKLARLAGGDAIRDPDAFRESIPHEVFNEWLADYAVEPWDAKTDAVIECLAILCAAEYNRDSATQKHKIKDFLPKWLAGDRESRAATDEWVSAFMSAAGGNPRGNLDRTNGAGNLRAVERGSASRERHGGAQTDAKPI